MTAILAAALSAAALLAAGCGSGGSATRSTTGTVRAAPTPATPAPPGGGQGSPQTVPTPPQTVPKPPQTVPTPGPTGAPPAASAVAVITAWSDALRRGDVRSAAGYFALPSVMINGGDTSGAAIVVTIGTRAQAEVANASLPCGARFISADQRGRYVNALFRLTGRPGPGGSDCGTGAGQTARTNFVIVRGRIVEWIRAPDDPGDNGTPRTPAPTPAPAPGPGPGPGSAPGGPTV